MSGVGGEEITRIVASMRCAICQHMYGEEHVRIVGRQRGGLWVVQARCPACETVALIFVVARDEWVDELLPEERERFASLGPLTGEDVAQIENALSRYGDDFAALLRVLGEG